MTTPDISHLNQEYYSCIYEPAEDTFLLIDSIEKDLESIKRLSPTICLEIGSGTGICLTFLAKELDIPAYYICTDINSKAAEISRVTGQKNGVNLEPVLTDLTRGLSDRLKNQVDVLLFNPPYVVTPHDEVGGHGIEAAWAGGKNGREVIDRVIPLVADLLSEKGIFYMVVIKENKPDEIDTILKKSGFRMNVVLSRRSGPEFLSVLKFTR